MNEVKSNDYHFFVIINDEKKFKSNTYKCLEDLKLYNCGIFTHYTYNYNNEFKSIRAWINSILMTAYESKDEFVDSKFVFIHQDVFLEKKFIPQLEMLLDDINKNKVGVFGFAGIDEFGKQHKFMNDSNVFCFTEDTEAIEVDSVDEFLFGVEFNILFSAKVMLSNIVGWHAYAAEFSILLSKRGYSTYMLPIFVTHNSIRVNNKGLVNTHDQLFNLYKTPLNTLVGRICNKSLKQKYKIKLYSFYVNNFKWKFKSPLIEKIKSFTLDQLGLNYNKNRVKQNLVMSFDKVFVIHYYKLQNTLSDYDININGIDIKFRVIFDLKELLKYTDDNVILSGFSKPISGFEYIEKIQLNVKRL
tara:strand:- start:2723 stop:3796 length:1074 start_codon:yes stop_codon:yes gene_type:complete